MDTISTDPTWKDGTLFPEMSRGPSSWTAERITELRQWTGNGLSAAEIADKMGVSRNSIIGKWHRLGMSSPVKERKPKPKPRADHWTGFPKRKSPDRKPPMIVDGYKPNDGEVVPLNISFEDLQTGQCKYPYGDAAPYLFCGHPAVGDCSWCPSHQDICFTGHSRGWERPDQTYRLRKLSGKNPLTQADDFPTPEQLPEVA